MCDWQMAFKNKREKITPILFQVSIFSQANPFEYLETD